jgi:hypothetical protein
LLKSQSGIVVPRWIEGRGCFADGSATIRQAFVRLVRLYGKPTNGSPVIDASAGDTFPSDDIL